MNSNMSRTDRLLFLVLFTMIQICSQKAHAQGLNTKEISQEVALQKGSLVRIVSNSGKLNIRSWDQAKVKVIVQFNADSSQRSQPDEKLLEEIGISVKSFSNRVDILKRPSPFQGKLGGKIFPRDPIYSKGLDGKIVQKLAGANISARPSTEHLDGQVMTIMVRDILEFILHF